MELETEFAELLRQVRRVRVVRKVGVLDFGDFSVFLNCRVDDGAQLELDLVVLEEHLLADVEVIRVDLLLPNLLCEIPDRVSLVLFLLLLVHVCLQLLDA